MKPFLSLLTVFGLLATACSTSGGGVEGGDDMGHAPADPGKVAGGQSGNDGTGSFACDLSDATLSDVAVETKPKDAYCSPADALSALGRSATVVQGQSPDPEHSVIFHCGAFGRYVVEVGPATSAQARTGVGQGEGSDDSGEPCVALVVESAITVTSLDGQASFEAQRADVDYMCWEASFKAERADGAKLNASGSVSTGQTFGIVIESGGTSVACSRGTTVYPPRSTEPEPTDPEPTDPTPTHGGAGGEGGARDPGQPGGAGGVESGGAGEAQ